MTRFANIAQGAGETIVVPVVVGKKVIVWGLAINGNAAASDLNIRSSSAGTDHVGTDTFEVGMFDGGNFLLPMGSMPWFVTDADKGVAIECDAAIAGCMVYDYIDNDEDLAAK